MCVCSMLSNLFPVQYSIEAAKGSSYYTIFTNEMFHMRMYNTHTQPTAHEDDDDGDETFHPIQVDC